MRFRLLGVVFLFWSAHAAADLYRWIDPETGSVKFSSYPPPWFGDPGMEKRAPKVEHIQDAKPAPATPAATPAPTGAASAAPAAIAGASLESLETQRKQLMQQLAGASMGQELRSGGTAIKAKLESFAAVVAEMDRLDPRGAEKRRAEAQPVLERIVEDLRTQLKPR